MNAALFTRNAPGNRGHILELRLDVTLARGKLGRLERITGIHLVSNHQWDNIEIREHRLRCLSPLSGQGEHFDHRGLSEIAPVLGPTFTMRDPDRVPPRVHGVTDILRQQLGRRQQRPRTTDIPLHNKALIESHQIGHPGLGEQIVTNGNGQRIGARSVQRVIGIGRVHHNIPVVTEIDPGGTQL